MRRLIMIVAFCLLAVGQLTVAVAAVPTSMTVQGKLTDAVGSPLPVGTKTFTFRVFDAATLGTQIWPSGGVGEVQSITISTDGLWVGLVGAVNPLTDPVFSDSVRWLEINVDGTTLPRVRLVTGPYALRVATVDGASGGTITSKVSIGPGHTNTGTNAFVVGQGNTANGDWSTVAGGSGNLASDTGAVVAGGGNNQARARYATVGGGGGSSPIDSNSASGVHSTIAGGSRNVASQQLASIGGGFGNNASGNGAAIAGGTLNFASGSDGAIGGGLGNTAAGNYSVVGGGNKNHALGDFSTVAGGGGSTLVDSNLAAGQQSTIGGGSRNNALGLAATVAGGFYNRAQGDYSAVGGGGGPFPSDSNAALGDWSFIGGGDGNLAVGDSSIVGGGAKNMATGLGSAVVGGQSNRARGKYSFIGGGSNFAGSDSNNVAGGDNSVIGGGISNYAAGSLGQQTIAGGERNSATGFGSTIGGGRNNKARGPMSFIGGGGQPSADPGDSNVASGVVSAIVCGMGNQATDSGSFVGSGRSNTATGKYAAISSGLSNAADGDWAAIPGGRLNSAAQTFSFAAGYRAKSNHFGTYVWADSTNADFASTAANQFLIRATGGVGIGTNGPEAALHVLSSSAGTVTASSASVAVFERSAGSYISILSTDATERGILFGSPANALMGGIRFNPSGAPKGFNFRAGTNVVRLVLDSLGNLTADGCVVGSNIACPSDGRFKRDIQTLPNALRTVEALRGVRYNWKTDEFADRDFPKGEQIGLIAQEVQKVVPQAVVPMTDGYLAVDYSRLVPLLIEAIKEQDKRINQLEHTIQTLGK